MSAPCPYCGVEHRRWPITRSRAWHKFIGHYFTGRQMFWWIDGEGFAG